MVDTLVFVSFDLKCPRNKQLNETLNTVAEYQWMNDDTFMLLGLRCELKEGGACAESRDCPLRNRLPLTLLPIDLTEQAHYLCFTDYETDELGRVKAVADCKRRFILNRMKASA